MKKAVNAGAQSKVIVLDEAGLLSAVEGDSGLLRDRVDLFLKDTPQHLAEITKAIESANRRLVEREAHTLRGAAGNIYGPRMAEAARRREQAARTGSLHEAGLAYAAVAEEVRRLQRALADTVRKHAA